MRVIVIIWNEEDAWKNSLNKIGTDDFLLVFMFDGPEISYEAKEEYYQLKKQKRG